MALDWHIDILWDDTEYILNGGYETLGGGGVWDEWSEHEDDGSFDNETVNVYSGVNAAKCTTGPSVDTDMYQTITVTAETDYELTIWTAGDGTYDGRYKVTDQTHAADIIEMTHTGVTGTDYEEVVEQFTTPAGCTSIRVYLYSPDTNGGICYYDEVSLLQWEAEEDRAVHPLKITRGRKDQFSSIQACKLTFTLDNSTERYDAWNTGSAIYPNVKPRRRVRVAVDFPDALLLEDGYYLLLEDGGRILLGSSTSYEIFHGRIEEIRPSGGIGNKRVTVTAYDGWKDFAGHSASIALQESITPDTAIGLLLDDVGWPDSPTYRDLDTGNDTLDYWWCNQSVRPALESLAKSEWGAFWISKEGKAEFMNRTAYITGTSVGTLDESEITDIQVSQPWDLIRNVINIKCRPVSLSTTTSEFVSNGGFEYGDPPEEWTAVNATLASYAVSTHSGSAALSVAATADTGRCRQTIDVTAGDSMDFSGWSLHSAAGHRGKFYIYDVDNAANLWAGAYADNAVWTEDTTTVVIPAGCTQVYVYCMVETSGETVYFDDISLTGTAGTIWEFAETGVSIAAGESLTIWAEYYDANNNLAPAKDVYEPIRYEDYTANSASDGSGTDMTPDMSITTSIYSQSAKLVIENTHGATTLYITSLAIRGKAITQLPIEIKKEDTDSQDDFGKRVLPLDVPWQQQVAVADSLGDLLIGFYPDPLRSVTVTLKQRFPDILQYDIMDRLTFTCDTYDIYEVFRLGHMELYTMGNMQALGARWHLEPADNETYWLLGDAGNSEMGETTRLGT